MTDNNKTRRNYIKTFLLWFGISFLILFVIYAIITSIIYDSSGIGRQVSSSRATIRELQTLVETYFVDYKSYPRNVLEIKKYANKPNMKKYSKGVTEAKNPYTKERQLYFDLKEEPPNISQNEKLKSGFNKGDILYLHKRIINPNCRDEITGNIYKCTEPIYAIYAVDKDGDFLMGMNISNGIFYLTNQ